MKYIIVFLIYVGVSIGMFLLLSTIGLIWGYTYYEIIHSGWVTIYVLFIGWWIGVFPANEYGEKYNLFS